MCPGKRDQKYVLHNFNKFARIAIISGKQHRESTGKLSPTSTNHCCCFTLQNEKVAMLLHQMPDNHQMSDSMQEYAYTYTYTLPFVVVNICNEKITVQWWKSETFSKCPSSALTHADLRRCQYHCRMAAAVTAHCILRRCFRSSVMHAMYSYSRSILHML